MKRNPVQAQVNLFAVIAAMAALAAVASARASNEAALALSITLLLLSPYIAYLIVIRMLKSGD